MTSLEDRWRHFLADQARDRRGDCRLGRHRDRACRFASLACGSFVARPTRPPLGHNGSGGGSRIVPLAGRSARGLPLGPYLVHVHSSPLHSHRPEARLLERHSP